jgi:SAM-dependent methyltransferase
MDITMDQKSKAATQKNSPNAGGETVSSKVSAKDLPRCLFCEAPLRQTVVDLGMSPLCESYVSASQLNQMEAFYPLHVRVCGRCFLVQLEEYVSPENIFSDYAYFSSYSDSWLAHAKAYTEKMTTRFSLGGKSLVVEVASNDGYLLQYFVANKIPVLGIEPAANVAAVAVDLGVPTLVKFFGTATARELVAQGKRADLLLGNNVLAQVPNLNDFVAGMKILLAPTGVITIEFPHLMRLMEENQFDTIYHEHFSYLSFLAVVKIFSAHGLTVFDVEQLATHGGSLRVFATPAGNTAVAPSPRVGELLALEAAKGYDRVERYGSFDEQARAVKRDLLEFLIGAKRAGKKIVGYGAPGKGNTLLNYCGIRTDFLDFTVDRNPYKQGKFTPGAHIPILAPQKLFAARPDYVLILPWNLQEEIMQVLAEIRTWGGRFIVPIPHVQVLE